MISPEGIGYILMGQNDYYFPYKMMRQQLQDVGVQKEQIEQLLRITIQWNEQLEKQVQDTIQQKEQLTRQHLDVIHQKDVCIQQLRCQAERAEERARVAEQGLVSLRQQAEAQIAQKITQLYVQNGTDYLKSSWMVEWNEVQVIQETPLGVGGWGQVKVAMFRGIKVAAKFLHESIVSSHNIELFVREMNMAACIRHPNLLLFIGASFKGGINPVIITELMPSNLRSIIRALPQDGVISVGIDVASGLNYLHLMRPDPIIHRDVSSANVLLEPIGLGKWRAKVSDYGSAHFVSKVSTVGPGNALYAAPESLNPIQQSPKMDVYSYGILLLEMATGQYPDPNLFAIRIETLLWREMAALVRRCTFYSPENRPDMKDLLMLLPRMKT